MIRPLQLRGTPELKEVKDAFGNMHRLGVLGITRKTAAGDVSTERVDPATALWLGVKKPGSWLTARWLTWAACLQDGKRRTRSAARCESPRFRVRSPPSALRRWCILQPCFSISIGLLNLFPVPLLDGGHLLFYAVEAVRGRPLSERAQEMGFRIGLGLVLMLMVFATYNDILHLAAS